MALDSSAVAAPLLELLSEQPEGFEGSASKLLEALSKHAPETVTRSKLWPANGRALASALLRLAPNLRAVGVSVEHRREAGGNRRRLWCLARSNRDLRPERPVRPEPFNGEDLARDANADAPSQTPGFASRWDEGRDANGEAGRKPLDLRPGVSARHDSGWDGRDGRDANAGSLSQEQGWPEGLEELEPELF